MTPTSKEISPGRVRPTQGVDECRAPSLESRVRGRITGVRLIETPVENLDDSEFDDFKDSNESLDLGLGEEPRSLLDYLHARHERMVRKCFQSIPDSPLHKKWCYMAISSISWTASWTTINRGGVTSGTSYLNGWINGRSKADNWGSWIRRNSNCLLWRRWKRRNMYCPRLSWKS